jgi:hypothetical protein
MEMNHMNHAEKYEFLVPGDSTARQIDGLDDGRKRKAGRVIHGRDRLQFWLPSCFRHKRKRPLMKHPILALSTLTVVALGKCIAADNAEAIAIGPVHTVTAELGVVPPGTSLVVRTKDTVKTRKAYRGTVYLATVAADILDQNGAVLIPRGSPIELVVHSLSYLGPGGAGMTLLSLDIDAVTVIDVRYPVETRDEAPGAGGIGVNRGAARWIGGSEEAARNVVTRGDRINVPADTLLAFEIEAPIRLRGYRR